MLAELDQHSLCVLSALSQRLRVVTDLPQCTTINKALVLVKITPRHSNVALAGPRLYLNRPAS